MKLPVLTYHKLAIGNTENRYTISEDEFISQLHFLSTEKYRCILVDDYYRLLLKPSEKLSRKLVAITFDDGDESNFQIGFKILKKYNFKATFFITTDFIGQAGYMNAEQLRILSEEGMSIQSHAKTHRFLNELSMPEIHNELEYSKRKIEQITNKNISFVSMPGGRYSRKVINCAKELEYRALFTSVPYHIKNYDDFYLIGRNMVTQSRKNSTFYNTIKKGSFGIIKHRVAYMAKSLLRKVFGNKIYHFLWKKYNASV